MDKHLCLAGHLLDGRGAALALNLAAEVLEHRLLLQQADIELLVPSARLIQLLLQVLPFALGLGQPRRALVDRLLAHQLARACHLLHARQAVLLIVLAQAVDRVLVLLLLAHQLVLQARHAFSQLLLLAHDHVKRRSVLLLHITKLAAVDR